MIVRKKIKLSYLLALSFVAGILFWKLKPSLQRSAMSSQISHNLNPLSSKSNYNKTLVSINDSNITMKDLQWEYRFLTHDLSENPDLRPDKNQSNTFSTEFIDLKQQLLSDVVERKVLVSFIKKDSRFDFDNKVRKTSCLSQLAKLTKESSELKLDKEGNQILETRLCENQLITQYINEFIRPKIKISKKEALEYYRNNKEEFHFKKRVVVQQIVLATEKEARIVLSKVNRNNFRQYVRSHSISPEPNAEGVYGPLEKGDFSGAFDTAFRMRQGQIHGVVKTAYGFQILHLVKKLKSGVQSFDDTRPIIVAKLTKQKFSALYEQLLESALASSSIKSQEKIW